MSRRCLLVKHSDLRSSGREICSHYVSTDRAESDTKRGAGEASYVAKDYIFLDIERKIIEANWLRIHLDRPASEGNCRKMVNCLNI